MEVNNTGSNAEQAKRRQVCRMEGREAGIYETAGKGISMLSLKRYRAPAYKSAVIVSKDLILW